MAVALTVTIGRGAGGEEIERDLVNCYFGALQQNFTLAVPQSIMCIWQSQDICTN